MGIQTIWSNHRRGMLAGVVAIAFAVVLANLLLDDSTISAAPERLTAGIATLAVNAGTTAQHLQFDGRIEAEHQTTLAAQVPAVVRKRLVRAGDAVARNQLLIQLDDRDTRSGVQQAAAGVGRAEAEATQARKALQRAHELHQRGLVSVAAQDAAEASAGTAEAVLEQARAALRQAQLAQGYTEIRAPYAGLITDTLVEAGDLATPGRALIAMYAPTSMRAVVDMAATRSSLARQANSVAVGRRNAAGQIDWVTAVTRREVPATDPVTQTVSWQLDLPEEKPNRWTPGQAVWVRFTTSVDQTVAATAAETLTIPRSALLLRGELTAVYVVQEQQFVLRQVRIGSDTQTTVEIIAGLAAGEVIAVDALQAGLAGAWPAE